MIIYYHIQYSGFYILQKTSNFIHTLIVTKGNIQPKILIPIQNIWSVLSEIKTTYQTQNGILWLRLKKNNEYKNITM